MPLERRGQIGGQVDHTLLVGLGRLNASQVPGPLDPRGPISEVEITTLQSEGAPPAAELEGGVRGEHALVYRVGEQHGQRRLHEAYRVLGVTLSALVEQQRFDVLPVDLAKLEMAQHREHVVLEAVGVATDGLRVLLDCDVGQPRPVGPTFDSDSAA